MNNNLITKKEHILKLVKHAMTALSLKEEMKLIFRNKKEFTGVFDLDTMFKPHSEISQGNYTKLENVKNLLAPLKISRNASKNPIIRQGNADSKIIYVNGICSSEIFSQYQQKTLSTLFLEDVELLYNQTDGFLFDILECMQDRLDHDFSKAAILVAEVIMEKLILNPKDKIYVIGYSQGTIIVTKAIQLLDSILKDEMRERLKLITFATACKNFDVGGIEAEHFINLDDPVCKIGYLEYSDNIDGNAYFQNKCGHLLVADYLSKIDSFQNYKESMFYQLLKHN